MRKFLLLSAFIVPSVWCMKEEPIISQEVNQSDEDKWKTVEELFEQKKALKKEMSELDLNMRKIPEYQQSEGNEEEKEKITEMRKNFFDKMDEVNEKKWEIYKKIKDSCSLLSEPFLLDKMIPLIPDLRIEKKHEMHEDDMMMHHMMMRRERDQSIIDFIEVEKFSSEFIQKLGTEMLTEWSDNREYINFLEKLIDTKKISKEQTQKIFDESIKLDKDSKFKHEYLIKKCLKTGYIESDDIQKLFELCIEEIEEVNGKKRCDWIIPSILKTNQLKNANLKPFWEEAIKLYDPNYKFYGIKNSNFAKAIAIAKVDGKYYKEVKELEKLYNDPSTNEWIKEVIEYAAEIREDVAQFLPVKKKPSEYKKSLEILSDWNKKSPNDFESDLKKEANIILLSKLYTYNQNEYNEELSKLTQKLPLEVQEKILPEILKIRMGDGLLEKDKPKWIDNSVMGEYFYHFSKNDVLEAKFPNQIIVNDWTEDRIKEGQTLMSCPHNPIGYIVFLPKNPKSVLIHVYGGYQKKDKDENRYHNSPGSFDQKMIGQDIAIIKLNLADLYRNETFQGNMSREMFKDILDSIQYFVKHLKEGKLKEGELQCLKDLPQFLFGASFGGGTVTRFLQEHPNTVDGSISWNGSLDDVQQEGWEKHLLAVEHTDKPIQDSLLLLASTHDNCVPLSESVTKFLDKARENGKSDKIATYITRTSNIESEKSDNVGHFYKDENDDVFSMITHFILNNKKVMQESDAVNKYRLHMAKIFKFLTDSDVNWENEWLLSCLKSYEKHSITSKKEKNNQDSFDNLWDAIFGPKLFETLIMRKKTQKTFGYKELQINEKEKKLIESLYKNNRLKNIQDSDIKNCFIEIATEKLLKLGFNNEAIESSLKEPDLLKFEHYEVSDWKELGQKEVLLMQEQILGEAMGKAFFDKNKNDPEYQYLLTKYKAHLKKYFDKQKSLLKNVFSNMIEQSYSQKKQKIFEGIRELKEKKEFENRVAPANINQKVYNID